MPDTMLPLEDQHSLFATIPGLAALFAELPDAVLVMNAEARIVWTNKAAERRFGHKIGAMVGRRGAMLYSGSVPFEPIEKRCTKPGSKAGHHYLGAYKRKSGETFAGETTGTAIRSSAGELTGFLVIIRDIS
jgi:PAS domain S-box-containing protein